MKSSQMALEAIRKAGVNLSIKQAEQIRKIIAGKSEILQLTDILALKNQLKNISSREGFHVYEYNGKFWTPTVFNDMRPYQLLETLNPVPENRKPGAYSPSAVSEVIGETSAGEPIAIDYDTHGIIVYKKDGSADVYDEPKG